MLSQRIIRTPPLSLSLSSTLTLSRQPPQSLPHFNLQTPTPHLNSLFKSFVKTRKFLQSLLLFKKICQFEPTLSHSYPLICPLILKSCASISHVGFGLSLHGPVIKLGFASWVDVSISLLGLYSKFRRIGDAYKLFDEMPTRDEQVYNFVICSFGSAGFYGWVLIVFEEMLTFEFYPYLESVRYVVVACGELKRLDKGIWVHNYVIDNGLDQHVLVGNSLISMYIKMGRLDLGFSAFVALSNKDIVSWNSLIIGYAHSGNWFEAFNVYLSMKKVENLVPNNVTLLGLVLCCGQAGDLDQGKSIHGHCIRRGLVCNFRLGTAILDMYAKCGSVLCAEMVFEEGTFERSLVSWNSLISGYSKNGYHRKALMVFKNMVEDSNMKPDSFTFANVVPTFSSLRSIVLVESIHALVIKKGLDEEGDVFLGTAMVDAYGKCLNLTAAKSMFACMKERETATWNAMIGAYYLNRHPDLGMLIFIQMLKSREVPDAVTFVSLFQLCGELGSLKQATMAHGYSLRTGFSSHLNVENAMIDMYMRCGSVQNSEKLLRLMSVKNIVTWNTMLAGYIKMGCHSCAIRALSQMLAEREHKPDSVSAISLIQASASVLSSHGADIAHAFAMKLGLDTETSVANSLIDAYAKNGMIENAESLFAKMGQMRDHCSWNVMIAGFGVNGQGEKACEFLKAMEEDGYRPDSITCTSLLSACSNSGLIEEGCRYFDLMTNKYKIKPNLEHWTCIINMFGRAGRLKEAYELVENVSYYDGRNQTESIAIWGTLLDASRIYSNVEIGEMSGKMLLKMAPENCGYRALMSNLYAGNERWDKVEEARRVFEEGNLVKKAGFSLVQI